MNSMIKIMKLVKVPAAQNTSSHYLLAAYQYSYVHHMYIIHVPALYGCLEQSFPERTHCNTATLLLLYLLFTVTDRDSFWLSKPILESSVIIMHESASNTAYLGSSGSIVFHLILSGTFSHISFLFNFLSLPFYFFLFTTIILFL